MRYFALACDYDGTIAHDGQVDSGTVAALQRFKATGRHLVLVTGRELDDLMRVHPELPIFDAVVAENGAVLYHPAIKEITDLCGPPPPAFAAELARQAIAPVSVGRAIVATWRPHEHAVIETIRRMGLELQVIFNKDAVMVLPSGVNKATGLSAALERLGLSVHNTVGIGDAENDHAFLSVCECSVAVSNAVASLKARADLVTEGDDGAGVAELIDRILATDLYELEGVLTRHEVLLGHTEDGYAVRLKPYGEAVLIAGTSGTGKSSITTAVLERLRIAGYQFCVVDPEGDYQDLEGTIALHGSDLRALNEEAMQILARPRENLVLGLLDVKLEDRPRFFQAFLLQIKELLARTGRPHWLVIDEAHHLLPRERQVGAETLAGFAGGLLMITVHPEHISHGARGMVRNLIVVGEEVAATARAFGTDPGADALEPPPRPGRWVCLFRAGMPATWIRIEEAGRERQRHRRKYAEGELGTDKSFYFRGPDGRLNLRAQNLALFSQIADGVDDATWLHHLRNGDYERWFRDSIGDEALAEVAADTSRESDLSASDGRARIRQAIDERYTAPF
jgi:hydroxymethylpyrimidine pyrophosphatase-like HAD family hydrolase